MESNERGATTNTFRPVANLVHRSLPNETTPEDDRAGYLRLRENLAGGRGFSLGGFTSGLFGRPALSAACAGAVVLVAGGLTWREIRPLTYEVSAGREGAQGAIETPSVATPARVRFSDGTDVELAPRARTRVASLDRRGARVILDDGRARVRVAKRPKARWTFEAGPYQVLVTGTAFDLDWSKRTRSLALRMRTGSVVVFGPAMGEKGRVLRGGEQLSTTENSNTLLVERYLEESGGSAPLAMRAVPIAAPKPSIDPPSPPSPPAVQNEPDAVRVGPRKSAPPRTWTQRVNAGEPAAVLREAERRGLSRVLRSGSSDDLAALADAARYTHESGLAQKLYKAQRQRFPTSVAAQSAAFHLGRLAQDVDAKPQRALDWYDAYLRETPQGAYAAEALGRKMIVQEKAQGRERACETARAYLRRHPEGGYARVAHELCPDRTR